MKTITLNQAKRLAELGVERKINHGYYWRLSDDKLAWVCVLVIYSEVKHGIPAYSAEELIKLLRAKEHIQIEIYSHGDGFMFYQEGKEDIYGATLTEALCNKLIYDLENGITTIEEVNK